MIFSLDVLRARKGDCLLLHFGSKAKPGLVMIDGGPKAVYQPYLRPRLMAIRDARKIEQKKALPVDLLMVSHVDDDHIQGILELTREELESPHRLLNVLSFWHNSFDSIIGSMPHELLAGMKGRFLSASGDIELSDEKIEGVQDEYHAQHPAACDAGEVVESSLKVLASLKQGFQLRHDADGLNYPLNPEFGGALVLADAKPSPTPIAQTLAFTVIGPMKPELVALHARHQAWLKELQSQGKTAEDTLASYVDKSVPNLSSIVVLAKFDGKSMLLTGDARGDKILRGLEAAELLTADPASVFAVNLLKVPHHGSANNLDNDFFRRIVAEHYVFSGNGEHGNPERESFAMLLAARGAQADYQIHLTYSLEEIDCERKKDWEKERNKELRRKKKNPDVKVRAKWSPAKHGLIAFFDDNPKLKKKLRIVADGEPHIVDLADPLAGAWPKLAG